MQNSTALAITLYSWLRFGEKGAPAHRLGVLFLALSFSAVAVEREQIVKCEADWSRVSGPTASGGPPVDKSGMLKSWLALESACRGTGVFEYRLAILYVAVDQPSNAVPLLVNTESWPGDYSKVAPFVRLNAQMKVYLAQTPFPRDQFNALKPQFLAALALAPDTAVANEQTSHYLMMIGDYADATKYATRSLEIDPNQWEANRTLTIAQVGLGQFIQAIASGVRTSQLNAEITKDPYFMYAWTKAYAGSGDITTAKQLLAVLAGEVPTARGTDDWNSTIEFVRKQIRAGDQKN